ncbi:hypothetical protein ACET3Z_012878 [Daucus carota]
MDESAMFGLNGDNDDMGWGKNLGVVDNGGEVDDGKWLQEICDTLERKCDEYNQSLLVSSEVKGSGEDDDDDCVILDGDPDKVGVESENVAVGGDSDELVVVGETGQVACRDYPHPRDLCAKLPFTSTPHEQYCNQCHCYVCDAPAPCLKWGTGISVSDHCHATGKVEFWNQQRKSLKISRQSTVFVPKVQCTSMSTQPIQTNQTTALGPQTPYNIPPAQGPMSAPNPSIQYQTLQTQVLRPALNTYMQYQAFQAQMARPGRTEAMNMTTIRGQSSAVPRTNLQPDLASLQSRNTGNNLARNRRHNVGSSGPRVNVTPAAMFKRSGTPGVASASNQRTGHLINGRGSTLYTRLPNAVLAPDNCNNVISAQANGNSSMCGPSLQQYMHQRPNIMAFQSQLQSRLFSQSTVATNQVFTQPLFSDLSNRSTVFLYSTTQPQIPSQKENVGSMSSRPGLPQPQVSLQPDLPNSSANTVPSQPPVSYQTSHASNYQQNIIQQQNQINNFGDTGFSEIALNWLTNTTIPSSQQSQEQNSQLPASGSFDEFDCFFSGSSAFDLIRDPWTLNGEESARISSESATATVDVGTLFG